MRYYILHNPSAGNGTVDMEKSLASLQGETVRQNIADITDYADFFASLEADDIVVLCGGDGTLNRFINATDGMDIRHEILYCAGGTGNDFLRDVGKTTDDAPFAVNKYMKDLPFVEVNGKRYRFLNGIGYGIDGYCCEVGDRQKATSDKPVNYTAIAIKGLLFHYKPTNATVTVDGVSHTYKKVWLAATMKGRYYGGGMMPAPKQDRLSADKKVSLLVMFGSGKFKTLMVFPSLFKGEHLSHTEMCALHEGHDITVTYDRPTALQIDGETVTGVTSYRVVTGAASTTDATAEAVAEVSV